MRHASLAYFPTYVRGRDAKILATIQMDEIATGSFKLDACGGPKQAGPFLSVERRLKKSPI